MVRGLAHGSGRPQPASREGDGAHEQAEIADEGWSRWGRVQGASIGLHLVSGLAIVADNRRRVAAHTPTTVAVVAKTVLTGAALAASAAAYRSGAELGDAQERADVDRSSPGKARSLRPGCGGCSGPPR